MSKVVNPKLSFKSFYNWHLSHENIPLTDKQLRILLNDNNARVIAYHELEKMERLEDLFNNKDYCIILYESNYNTGHYVSLILKTDERGNQYLEHFNSYGDDIEKTLSKFKYNKRDYLRDLIDVSKEEQFIKYVVVNSFKFQELKQQSQVCGRYACFRIIHKDLDLVNFNKLLRNVKKLNKISYDDFITLITDLTLRIN